MTVLSLRARSIGSPIAKVISTPSIGKVIATFVRSCYLELHGRIFALVAPELHNGPLNVVLVHLPENGLARLSTTHSARLSDGHLDVDGALSINLTAAEVWNARLPSFDQIDRNNMRAELDVVKSVLSDAPRESLAHTGSRPARVSEGMDAFYSALRHLDETTLGLAVDRLVGFGLGLTPSGDDVLAGALIALNLVGRPDASPFGEFVRQAVRGRTTAISIAYLEAASNGDAGESWHQLARALAQRSDGVWAAARRVMAFGETSGADMLTGFVLAAEALLTE